MVLRVPGVSPELSHEGFGHQGPPEVSSLHPVSRAPPVPNYGRKRGGPSPDHEVLSRAEPGAQGDLACRISGVGRVTKVAVVVVYVVVEAVTGQGNGPRDPLKRQNAVYGLAGVANRKLSDIPATEVTLWSSSSKGKGLGFTPPPPVCPWSWPQRTE